MASNKHKFEILSAFDDIFSELTQFCDLEVRCCDGALEVPGLLLAAVCPVLYRFDVLGSTDMRSISLVLPDLTCEDVQQFIKSCVSLQDQYESFQKASALKNVCKILGCSVDPVLVSECKFDLTSVVQDYRNDDQLIKSESYQETILSIGSGEEFSSVSESIRIEEGYQSVPGSIRIEEGYQSVPGSSRTEEGYQSVPGSIRKEEGNQSVPGSLRTEEGYHNVPGSIRIEEGYQSVPGSIRTEEGYQSVPGSIRTEEGYQSVPGSIRTEEVYQSVHGSFRTKEGYQSVPGSIRTEEGYQSVPGSIRTEEGYQSVPGSIRTEEVYQSVPGSFRTEEGYQSVPGSFRTKEGYHSVPGSIRTEEGYQSVPGSIRTEDSSHQTLPGSEMQEICVLSDVRQGEEILMLPEGDQARANKNASDEVKGAEVQNLCIFLDQDQKSTKDRKCLLNLAKIDISLIGDEVLEDNFCDQEGRLVCLVCYKIIDQNAFEVYRSHLQDHDARQLEKVYIIMPETGRGGPGIKKRIISDQDIKALYLDENGDLSCKECSKTYKLSEKANFKRHIQYHSFKDKNYVYVCNECNREFNNSSNLTRHIKLMHEEKQTFRCLHCDFEDKIRERLENHLLNVHKDKGWVYDDVPLSKGLHGQELGEITEPVQSLTDESLTDDKNSTVFKCSGCNFRRRIRENIAAHIRQQHDSDPDVTIQKVTTKPREPRPLLKCEECNATLSTMTQLLQHKIKVHDYHITESEAEDLKCAVCEIVCATKSGLRAHERSHQEKKFLCISCEKPYMNLYQLREHIQKGLCKDESRTCKLCNKLFIDKHRLMRHMKIHNNVREFKCQHCDKSFIQKRTLKEHILTHNSTRQFECKVCLKKFVQQNHLKYHLSSQHPSSCSSDETRHKCTLCSKAFPFQYLLRKHQRVHGKVTAASNSGLQCSRCSTWFSSPILLKDHHQLKQCWNEGKESDSMTMVSTKIHNIDESCDADMQVIQGIDVENETMVVEITEDCGDETTVVVNDDDVDNANEMCVVVGASDEVVEADNQVNGASDDVEAGEITIEMTMASVDTSLDLE